MLTDHEIGLLYEIYEISFRSSTVIIGGSGQLSSYDTTVSVQETLASAITSINSMSAQVERVRVILKEFEELSLDPSNIDKDGYQLRPSHNLRTIRTRLYPYTGILFNTNRCNGTILLG